MQWHRAEVDQSSWHLPKTQYVYIWYQNSYVQYFDLGLDDVGIRHILSTSTDWKSLTPRNRGWNVSFVSTLIRVLKNKC